MARKRWWEEEEFNLFKKRMRGIYAGTTCYNFPIDYPLLPKVRLRMSDMLHSHRPVPEAVFKIASFIKTKAEAARAVSYVAERSEGMEEAITLYDEERRDLNPEEAQKKLDDIKFDQKSTDSRNMIHFIVSFPKRMNVSEGEAKLFMDRYMEAFGDAGYSYMYGVHKHQSMMHGHVIMTLSNGRDPKLRFRMREIQHMRQHQVEIAKTFGWEMQATMCKDRELNRTHHLPSKKKTLLERQVPAWYKARKREESSYFLAKIVRIPVELSAPASQSLKAWSQNFDEPVRAEHLFVEMYAENKKTAFWYANNRAKVFGDFTRPPPVKLTQTNFAPPEAEIARFRPLPRDKEQGQSLERGIER